MVESISVLQIVLTGLKLLSLLIALVLLTITAGWLRGADSLAFPGLGLVVATPVVIMSLTLVEIFVMIVAVVVSALGK